MEEDGEEGDMRSTPPEKDCGDGDDTQKMEENGEEGNRGGTQPEGDSDDTKRLTKL